MNVLYLLYLQVMYVPDPGESGLDTFSYSANDCPNSANNWAAKYGKITLNVVPVGVSGRVVVKRYSEAIVNFTSWSVNTVNPKILLNFTITTLPDSGK